MREDHGSRRVAGRQARFELPVIRRFEALTSPIAVPGCVGQVSN
jgi:hypothetical protein